MRKILLNSIAVEPNRWSREKIPHFALKNLLPPIVEAGFDGVEVWQNHLAFLGTGELEALVDTAGRLGVDFPVVGIYPELHHDGTERGEEMKRVLSIAEKAAEIGAVVLKMMPGRIASADMGRDAIENSVLFLSELIESTADQGFILTLETHEGTLADSVPFLLSFIDRVGSERLKVCWQPYDFMDTDKAVALYDALSRYIVHLHLQGKKGGEMALLEEADIDYARVLSHMVDAGLEGYVSIEFVKDCVVDSPERFDLSTVLGHASCDREFAGRYV